MIEIAIQKELLGSLGKMDLSINLSIEAQSFIALSGQSGSGKTTLLRILAGLEKAKTEQARAANDYVQALADLMQSCGTPLEFNQYMQTADIKLPAIYFEHSNN